MWNYLSLCGDAASWLDGLRRLFLEVAVVAVSCGGEKRKKKLGLRGLRSSWTLRMGYPLTHKTHTCTCTARKCTDNTHLHTRVAVKRTGSSNQGLEVKTQWSGVFTKQIQTLDFKVFDAAHEIPCGQTCTNNKTQGSAAPEINWAAERLHRYFSPAVTPRFSHHSSPLLLCGFLSTHALGSTSEWKQSASVQK